MTREAAPMMVLVAAGSAEEARAIARDAIERQLAACAQVFPIQSYYQWEGQTVEDDEYLVLLKSEQAAYAELEAGICAIHSYDVPEIIALPIAAGLDAYLNWLHDTVAGRVPSREGNQ